MPSRRNRITNLCPERILAVRALNKTFMVARALSGTTWLRAVSWKIVWPPWIGSRDVSKGSLNFYVKSTTEWSAFISIELEMSTKSWLNSGATKLVKRTESWEKTNWDFHSWKILMPQNNWLKRQLQLFPCQKRESTRSTNNSKCALNLTLSSLLKKIWRKKPWKRNRASYSFWVKLSSNKPNNNLKMI